MPLVERARYVLANEHQAQWLQPEQWPEVRFAVVAFRDAVGKPNLRVGRYADDAGIKRLVELFAAECTGDEVCSALPLVVASAWWRQQPRDLGSISLRVVRQALAERPANDLASLPRKMFGGGGE